MDSMRQAAPIHRVNIELYHYEWRTHRNSKGQTSRRRVRIVTYRESRDFLYDRSTEDYKGNKLTCLHNYI